MSAHTIGPWEYDAEAGVVIAPKCGYQWTLKNAAPIVCEVESLDYNEGNHNGRLIAASPDLLAALQTLLGQVLQARDGFDIWPYAGSNSMRETLEQVNAAIAKATGSAS